MLKFALQHPGWTFLITVVLAWVITRPFWLLQLVLRSINIQNHGWPPAHLDADGDRHVDEKAE
jgi:hypothetical protein